MHTFSSYFPPPTECSLKISLSVLRIRLKFWFLTPDSFKTQQFQAFDIALIFIHQPVLHILNGQEKLRCSLAKQQTPIRPSSDYGQIAPLIFIQASFQDKIS